MLRYKAIRNLALIFLAQLAFNTHILVQAVELDLNTIDGIKTPGETVSVQMILSKDGDEVSAVAMDIGFDSNILSVANVAINPEIGPGTLTDRQLISNVISPGVLRIGIIPANFTQESLQKTILDGLVATITFYISPDAPGGVTTLFNNPASVISDGQELNTIGTNAEINIRTLITLNEGWNLISFPVSKCFYVGTPPENLPECVEKVDVSSDGSLAAWLRTKISPPDAWEMVVGSDGIMDNSANTFLHSLKSMSCTSGYWLKIKPGMNAVLSLDGPLFDTSYPIPLPEGWSLLGFPLEKGYHDTPSPPDGKHVPEGTQWEDVTGSAATYMLRSIQGKYDMVIGEDGAYNPGLGSENSSLHYMGPGYGYWIRMNQAGELIYSQAGEPSIFAAPGRWAGK